MYVKYLELRRTFWEHTQTDTNPIRNLELLRKFKCDKLPETHIRTQKKWYQNRNKRKKIHGGRSIPASKY